MKVTQVQIIERGLTHRCPNCGEKTLFREGKPFEVNRTCSACGFSLEAGEGHFLGALAMNYIFTCVVFLAPTAILWATGVLSVRVAAALGLTFAVVIPVLLYRSSRSWVLALWYFFVPDHLPANGGTDETRS